jgi:hypothetical protein
MPVTLHVAPGEKIHLEVRRQGYWTKKFTLGDKASRVIVRLAPRTSAEPPASAAAEPISSAPPAAAAAAAALPPPAASQVPIDQPAAPSEAPVGSKDTARAEEKSPATPPALLEEPEAPLPSAPTGSKPVEDPLPE